MAHNQATEVKICLGEKSGAVRSLKIFHYMKTHKQNQDDSREDLDWGNSDATCLILL